MPSLLDSCEKYFNTRNLYELLEIPKESLEKDIKKAYYKISLKVHPDRVPEEDKEIATEKFKVLAKVHQVLTDQNKRALYDEQGVIENDEDEGSLSTWLELWKKIFKPITTEDIENYEKEYVGSDLERADIKKAYLGGKGCLNHIINSVPFIAVEDEPRLKEIVQEMIDAEEVPEFKIFTNEPAAKRKRRHQKYAREKLESDELKKRIKQSTNLTLEQQIMKRQESRQNSFTSLMDKLIEKYGDEDDDDVVDFDALEAKSKKKIKKVVEKTNNKKSTTKAKERLVRNGKVKKKKAD
ncbi:J domain-containing protein CG6693 [Episyrphus balteatus]|uniref:J domain-containing protein CG6693 n=1 Tax=Episyrphus balteatus TaxID=286459 RepID=UPI0024857408|nr:J domain-containing protein CG6693 [Episyrphus balteatus]